MTNLLNEAINLCLEKNLNFVIYRLPGDAVSKIIIEDPSLGALKNGFIFHPFEISKSNPEVFISAHLSTNSDDITLRFIDHIKDLQQTKSEIEIAAQHQESKDSYLKNVSEGINQIGSSTLQKFIYSRVVKHYNTDNLDLPNYFISLNKSYKNTLNYLFHHHQTGTWIGATPEVLGNWQKGIFNTVSLAGTLPNTPKENAWSTKEIDEQNLVTSSIISNFNENNIPFQLEELKEIIAGPVKHLQTKISSRDAVSFNQAWSLVKSLHPTPAICGLPMNLAKQTIQNLESYDRRYYTGFLGEIKDQEELRLFVNLRCMQIYPNQLALYVGGGITEGSIPENEWIETENKSKTLLNVIANE